MRIVLDQGGFRSPELIRLIEDPAIHFLVPDVALEEMMKTNPAYTMERSFSPLRSAVDRIFVCRSVKEALEWEGTQRRSITAAELVDDEYTDVARTLISRAPLDKFESFLAKFVEMSGQGARTFDAAKDKSSLVKIVTAIKAKFGKPEIKILASTSLEEELGVVLALAEGALRATGEFVGDMRRRKTYSEFLYAISWVKKHGVESAKPERIAHDAFDAEYVLTGSFFDKVLSGDQKMMPLDASMRMLCDTSRHPRLLALAKALEHRLFKMQG
ncbi:hypothetical protein [Oryzifoliimicrobium ureilyticus]|uniref:hypothetical protein n=1 Tax=Oryzifoliimicrobium ureilyticus TaxID=3113724 RepID=UPI00307667BF